MKRKFHTPEQIIKKLREADAIMAQGGTVDQRRQVCVEMDTAFLS